MNKLTYLIFFIILLTCTASSETIFRIDKNSIKSVRIIQDRIRDDYDILVLLTNEYQSKLENITSKKIHKELIIEFDGYVLVKTTVEGTISSGNIMGGDFSSESKALEFLKIKLGNRFDDVFINKEIGDTNFRKDKTGSLFYQISKDRINYKYDKVIINIENVEKLLNANSKKYHILLVEKLLMNFQINDFYQAELEYKKLLVWINTYLKNFPNLKLNSYNEDGLFDILILYETNKKNKSYEKLLQYEKNIDFSDVFNMGEISLLFIYLF